MPPTSTARTHIAAATRPTLASPPTAPGADEMMSIAAACAFFGGDRPLNPATLYRGIKRGRYPPPVRQGSRMSRWLRSECEVARRRLAATRTSGFEPEV